MSNEYQDNLRLENRCARTPLLIGITGHRDLRSEDEPLLREQLRSIFSTLRARYRSTPFLLLSSLAEGADRLAARVALECGAELCTVLPMPLDYYMRDFTSDHSIEEFQELYSHSSGTLFIPLEKESKRRRCSRPRSVMCSIYKQVYLLLGIAIF